MRNKLIHLLFHDSTIYLFNTFSTIIVLHMCSGDYELLFSKVDSANVDSVSQNTVANMHRVPFHLFLFLIALACFLVLMFLVGLGHMCKNISKNIYLKWVEWFELLWQGFFCQHCDCKNICKLKCCCKCRKKVDNTDVNQMYWYEDGEFYYADGRQMETEIEVKLCAKCQV